MSERSISRTLGVDPGGKTGWSNGKYYGQLPAIDFLVWLDTNIHLYDRVAMERFSTRKLTPDSEETLELVGAVKWICHKARVSVGMVQASARYRSMSSVSDHIEGKHAIDAEAVRLWDLEYGTW